MHPSRPSSTDPNAPYRAAIAALGGHPVNEGEDAQGHAAPAQYQPIAQEGLPARRHVNRDRLNQIAHHLGSGVQYALEIMMPAQPHPDNIAGPSNAAAVASQVAANPDITVRDVQEYLRTMGYQNINMSDQTVRIRLDSARTSAATILTALQILHDANHPLHARFDIRNNKRQRLIDRLIGIVNRTPAFRAEIRAAVQGANNNPEQLIVNLLPFARR